MNKSFKSIGYVGLLLVVVSCAYSSDSEYGDYIAGYYSDYIGDVAVDDYARERGVYREHKKSRERALHKHSLALKKIAQRHNGSLYSPNANGGMGFEREEVSGKVCASGRNQEAFNRKSAIIAIPVIDYAENFKRVQEKLKSLIDAELGENIFQAKQPVDDRLHLHCTLLYIDNYKSAETQSIHTAISRSLRILKGLTPLVAEGAVELFGARGQPGRTFLGVRVNIDDDCINAFRDGILGQLPVGRQRNCRKCEDFHLSLGHIDINNHSDGQILKDIIHRSNVQCAPYVHNTTLVYFRIPGVKDSVPFRFAPSYAERRAQPTGIAAPVAPNPIAPNSAVPHAGAQQVDIPDEEEALGRRTIYSDNESDASDVPEDWEDISFKE